MNVMLREVDYMNIRAGVWIIACSVVHSFMARVSSITRASCDKVTIIECLVSSTPFAPMTAFGTVLPTAKMADCGGLRTATNSVMANMPRLETDKDPPWNSSGISLLIRALPARSFVSDAICAIDFLSAPRTTGVTSPAGVAAANATSIVEWNLRASGLQYAFASGTFWSAEAHALMIKSLTDTLEPERSLYSTRALIRLSISISTVMYWWGSCIFDSRSLFAMILRICVVGISSNERCALERIVGRALPDWAGCEAAAGAAARGVEAGGAGAAAGVGEGAGGGALTGAFSGGASPRAIKTSALVTTVNPLGMRPRTVLARDSMVSEGLLAKRIRADGATSTPCGSAAAANPLHPEGTRGARTDASTGLEIPPNP
mmetsp:Transcript_11534/g.22776  ORF Transcript_11534/g.22776 Transcript_11534/m.22776 type:complete len:375 (-) Transcript_11534:91-1215(-)